VTATPHGMAQEAWRAGSEGKQPRLARTAIAAARIRGSDLGAGTRDLRPAVECFGWFNPWALCWTGTAEKFAILTQLSSWFRYFDNCNVGFAIIGHQT
jgi:hypothetical protein